MMYVNVCIMCFSHRLAFTVFACQGKGKAKARASESRKWDLKKTIEQLSLKQTDFQVFLDV